MTTLMVLIWVSVFLTLLVVLAFRPERTLRSWSELRRLGDRATLRREKLLGDVVALQRVVVGLLLIGLVLLGALYWQAVGIWLGIGAWLVAGGISRWKPLHHQAMNLYNYLEPNLLDFVEKFPFIGRLLRTEKYVQQDQKVESEEHLLHLVESSGHVLSSDQQDIISRGITWHNQLVSSIMTPVENIVSIKHTELLGPLVLDDLHQSDHYRFPVTKGSIDKIIGILDISNLLDVSVTKRSETAEKAMSSEVLKIDIDTLLPVALAMLQKSHANMLIVVNDEDKTLGLVTFADIITSLVGKNRGGVV
jgi:CBS domain-containing protein